jgi:pentatricopeptide repeat protein
MFWLMLVIIFIFSLIMGFLDAPLWITYLVMVPIVFVFLLYQSPLLFGKDVSKMMIFLQKSKKPYYQFLYYLFEDDDVEAEKTLQRIRPERFKIMSKVTLLTKQKRYNDAKNLLDQMKDDGFKWYNLAGIAINEGDYDTYNQYKGRIKNQVQRTWLEIEEKTNKGKKAEAIALLDEQISNLKGYKLLAATHYRKELSKR